MEDADESNDQWCPPEGTLLFLTFPPTPAIKVLNAEACIQNIEVQRWWNPICFQPSTLRHLNNIPTLASSSQE